MTILSQGELWYLIAWLSALIGSAYLLMRCPECYEISTRIYWKFLLQPWKMFSFVVSTALLALAAPYSGDPTWDYADSIIVALFTYTTSPWAVGVLYRSVKAGTFSLKVFVALSLFFTPCWSYDFYILIRDGYYPATWLPNLVISSTIALSAALFWNLAWHPDKGTCFAFMHDPWLEASAVPLKKLLIAAMIITVPFLLMLGIFLYQAQ
ncbi:MAG: hypothetical protein H7839_03230 [Magnetococcus sp. YQC-5]